MSDQELRDLLAAVHTIAVVGLSSRPERMSYVVADYLRQRGYRLIPINPNETEVFGESAYPNLEQLSEQPELIQVFRRPEAAGEILRVAAERFPGITVWFQDGAADAQTAELAAAAGVPVVLDDCLMRQHRRLFAR